MYAAWAAEISMACAGATGPWPGLPAVFSSLPLLLSAAIGTPSYEHLSGYAYLTHHVHMSEDGGSAPDTAEASYLLVLTHSRPAEALSRARALVSRRPPLAAGEASIAHQAIGIALRDLGHLNDGLAELRQALRLAVASGRPQRQADVRASLGLTMALGGSTSRGLAHLDNAVLA